jgi:hypothetical protein
MVLHVNIHALMTTAATDTTAQPKVATPPGSPVEASLPEVQSPPSVPDFNPLPTTPSEVSKVSNEVSESEPVIVETIWMPSTDYQHDDDPVGRIVNDPSAATPLLVTQECNDNIHVTKEVTHHIETHYSDDNDFEMFDSMCGHDVDFEMIG